MNSIKKELILSKNDLELRNRLAHVFLLKKDDTFYTELLEIVLVALESEFGHFGYVNESGDLVCPSMTRDIYDKCAVPDKKIVFPHSTWGNSLWGRSLLEKKSLLSNENLQLPKGHIQIRNALAVPVIHTGELIAQFVVGNKDSGYSLKEQQILETIAEYVAPILHSRIAAEVSERKHKLAEIALRESETRYKALHNASFGGIAIHDKGIILECNRGLAEMTGYSINEMIGMDGLLLIAKESRDYVLEQILSGYEKPYEVIGLRKNEEQYPVRLEARNIPYKNTMVRSVEFRDITEHKKFIVDLQESEERTRLALQGADLGFWDYDIPTGNTYFDKRWLSMLDYVEGDIEYNVNSWKELLHPDDLQRVIKTLKKHFDNFERLYETEFRLKTKSGNYKWILARGEVLKRDSEGKPLRMYGTHLDITDRKYSEDELLKSRKLESVGLLAGGIAHDFNNILTGLFGNLELAKMKLTTDHAAFSYIQNSAQALNKATKLTQQLLTFAIGGDPILEIIEIEPVITDSIKLSLSGSNVKTTLNIADNLWQIKADKGQLSQVITNLVINADHAMPEGGMLTFDAENIVDCKNCHAINIHDECVKLRISDEGSGISAEDLKQIFDPYFTTKQAGHGLGLATVHSIIKKHNGYISVVSEPDVGTTFTIYLPAVNSIHQTTETTTGMTESSDHSTGHILVMDDDEMILNLSTEMIKLFGYTVDTAVDGKEAIEKYLSAQKCGKAFDVVIIDLTVPGGMGGKEALQELLAIDPEVKAIVSSGYSTDPIMANHTKYGFKGRLIKPFQMADLQKELSLHIVQK